MLHYVDIYGVIIHGIAFIYTRSEYTHTHARSQNNTHRYNYLHMPNRAEIRDFIIAAFFAENALCRRS